MFWLNTELIMLHEVEMSSPTRRGLTHRGEICHSPRGVPRRNEFPDVKGIDKMLNFVCPGKKLLRCKTDRQSYVHSMKRAFQSPGNFWLIC